MRRTTLGGGLLILLALCALLMSAAFFLHVRQVASDRMAMAETQAHILPGLTVTSAQSGTPGLIVTSIQSNGQADRLGVDVGDDILAIDGRAIRSLDQAGSYLIRDERDTVVLRLSHEGRMRSVSLDRSGE